MYKVPYEKNKVFGGIWGLIIGDAVGVPYEFNSPDKIPSMEEIDIITPKHFTKTYGDIPFGTYSDDSAEFLCTLDSYIECNGFDIENLASKFLQWLKSGLWAVDNEVFDVGTQTMKTIQEYARGTSPTETGFIVPEGKGNGSLMRTLAIPILQKGSDLELIKEVHKQSIITHGHICNQICCAFYSLIAKNLLNNMEFEEAYQKAIKTLKDAYKDSEDYLYEFENNILNNDLVESGTGYVIDCLKSSFKVIRESSSYEEVIKRSIALGNDTDTTAAVAGGLAGIIYGFDSLPKRWYDNIRGKGKICTLINKIEFSK